MKRDIFGAIFAIILGTIAGLCANMALMPKHAEALPPKGDKTGPCQCSCDKTGVCPCPSCSVPEGRFMKTSEGTHKV